MLLKYPSTYLAAWFVLSVVALFFFVAVPWLAFIIGAVAGMMLLIGCVAQGVRVGMNAHRDDRLIEKYAHVSQE